MGRERAVPLVSNWNQTLNELMRQQRTKAEEQEEQETNTIVTKIQRFIQTLEKHYFAITLFFRWSLVKKKKKGYRNNWKCIGPCQSLVWAVLEDGNPLWTFWLQVNVSSTHPLLKSHAIVWRLTQTGHTDNAALNKEGPPSLDPRCCCYRPTEYVLNVIVWQVYDEDRKLI